MFRIFFEPIISDYLIFLFAGEELIKKVSAMNFYAYRLMIRANEDNILRCRQLFHQYNVDMYVKIESERLRYIKFGQTKTSF